MAAALPQTTAELLLRAAEGTYVLGPEVSTDDVARFLGGNATRAKSALEAARELGFVLQGQDGEHWNPAPLAQTLAAASPAEKPVLLRFQLERYRPYAVFKARVLAGEGQRDAARQTCVAADLVTDDLDVEETLVNWGLYSGGLVYGDEKQLLAAGDEVLLREILVVQESVLAQRDTIQAHVTQHLGVDAASFATGEVLDALVDSYLTILGGGPYDQAMFQLGKGLEAWVKGLADLDPALTLPQGTNTMGAVANFLRQQSRTTGKHHSILMGVVAIRNAADHSVDADIGATWDITRDTALAASHLTWALMRSFFAARLGNFAL